MLSFIKKKSYLEMAHISAHKCSYSISKHEKSVKKTKVPLSSLNFDKQDWTLD